MWRTFADFVLGAPAGRRLPQRVHEQIEAQQRQAEVLISCLQLFLILFFIVLYTISPKTSTGTPFRPVPFALLAYLIFTFVRLALARRGALPGWLLVGSVVADISLLLVLIWSFHIQYAQPAPFYLKAPTLLYVFIFIALRTLRFEPTYVAAAGLTAAAGWLALLWYAIEDAGRGSAITRDYVNYLTTNSVLIGAEIDKVITIVLVTGVLAISIVRARRLLVRAVSDSTIARDLRRFVAPEIASRIVSAERAIGPGDAEVKDASVLFCDIEGFSGLAERLPADRLMAMLNEYFEAVSAVVDSFGGVITQYQGDAMLITFNAARPNPRHAESALRTALGIQRVVTRQTFGPGLKLPTRCGINTGEMVTGAVGTPERLYFTVYGDNVNIAARLEQLNKQYGTYVLATAETVQAAGGTLPAQAIGTVAVRGRQAEVDVYAFDPPPTGDPQTEMLR